MSGENEDKKEYRKKNGKRPFRVYKKKLFFSYKLSKDERKRRRKKSTKGMDNYLIYIWNGYWFFTYMWMSVYPLVLSYLYMNVGEWRYVLNILICRNFYDSISSSFPDHHLYGMDFYYSIDSYFLLELFTTLFLHMDYLSAHTAICT